VGERGKICSACLAISDFKNIISFEWKMTKTDTKGKD
jgi:hypothetical protein